MRNQRECFLRVVLAPATATATAPELCLPCLGHLCRPQASCKSKRVLHAARLLQPCTFSPIEQTCETRALALSTYRLRSEASRAHIVVGLKMPDEDDGFASKILLMRAGNKSKAQSWLKASLGDDSERPEDNLTSATEDTNNVFADLQGNEEIAGIGAPKKQTGDDDGMDRKVLSANDALRKKLLSREAYQRYQQGGLSRLDASKPMPKVERSKVEDDSDEEEKGRSAITKSKQSKAGRASDSGPGSGPGKITPQSEAVHQNLPSKSKKRPGSYLDQLLAERGKKKKSKSESKGG